MDRHQLIIGCGNDHAGDDAAGLEAVRWVASSLHPPAGCEFHLAHQVGPELLDVFERATSVVFLDAIVSSSHPGTIVVTRLPSKAVLPRHVGSLSTHGWGVGEVVALGAALGRPMPPMALIGIEIASAMPGAGMCPEVAEAVEYVAHNFGELLTQAREVEPGQVVVVTGTGSWSARAGA